MKRFLGMLTVLTLVLSLAAPALAEENSSPAATAEAETETVAGAMVPVSTAEPNASPTQGDGMDDALAAIALTVKNTLGVSDDYTSFTGNYNEYVQNTWSLDWSGTDGSLDVTADEQGKILSAYFYLNSNSGNTFGGFNPRLPTKTDEAKKTASDWLAKLMGKNETAQITDTGYFLNSAGSYNFTGTIQLNGLDSPVTFTICINADLSLQSYSRSDASVGYLGGVPGAQAAATKDDASGLLKAAVKLEFYYVADGENAALTYVPCGPTTIVDASSGQSVDMDALYASFTGSGYGNGGAVPYATTEDTSKGGAVLTPVEQSTISNYDGVMSKDALDKIVRSNAALGADSGFTLKDCSYTRDDKTGDVSAKLRYAKTMTGDDLCGYSEAEYENSVSMGCTMDITKYIDLNAKTGDLNSVSTNYPLTTKNESASLSSDKLAANADAFLKASASDHYADTALCTLSVCTKDGYTYAREANGYFYPANYLYVSLNASTGTVDSFTKVWDDGMKFAPADQIVDETAAKEAYAQALTVTLGYAAWPEDVDYDNPVFEAAIQWGYTWVESLKLAYYYKGTDAVSGVDAITGKAIPAADTSTAAYTYDDLDSSPHKPAIEALGAAGVGLPGGKFQPRAAVTQRTAAKLLLQACGYDVSAWDDGTLGLEAAYMGFISASDWNPDAWMTRMDFLRAMIGASPYGKAAALTGVWSVSYSDAGSVDAGDLGFAAVSQALGIVTDDSLSPAITCTRAFAAQMMYNYMTRA